MDSNLGDRNDPEGPRGAAPGRFEKAADQCVAAFQGTVRTLLRTRQHQDIEEGCLKAQEELDCPSPATHAILTVLEAGESVIQTLLLAKTVVHVYREAQPLFHALFWRQNTV